MGDTGAGFSGNAGKLLEKLREELDSIEWETWIEPLNLHSQKGMRIVFAAPNEHFVHTLEQGYREAIDRCVLALGLKGLEVLFTITDEARGVEPKFDEPKFQAFLRSHGWPKDVAPMSLVNFQGVHLIERVFGIKPDAVFLENPELRVLLINGPPGTGKTHLASAIGRALYARLGTQRSHVEFRHWRTWLSDRNFYKGKKKRNPNSPSQQADLLDDVVLPVEDVFALILDDVPFDARMTRHELATLADLMTKRFDGLRTIITTNGAPNQIRPPKVASRCFAAGRALQVTLVGPDRRIHPLPGMFGADA